MGLWKDIVDSIAAQFEKGLLTGKFRALRHGCRLSKNWFGLKHLLLLLDQVCESF